MEETQSAAENILKKTRDRVEECFVTIENLYKVKIPRCRITFCLSGTTAGTANYGTKHLRFNRKLLIANFDHFIADTIPHEVSHIADFCLNPRNGTPRKPHGPSWKKVFIEAFHAPPRRCHQLDVSSVRRKTKTYKYSCGCVGKTHEMGAIRHKKAVRGAVFTCNKCRTEVSFVGRDEKPAAAPNKYLRETQLD